ncbi:fungal-specific transcription factor domain-containing protein [Crassisporium funariophilum]|nr:fungal-specific transcription factor domain-containing protein [Crassisporium funariophilum]
MKYSDISVPEESSHSTLKAAWISPSNLLPLVCFFSFLFSVPSAGFNSFIDRRQIGFSLRYCKYKNSSLSSLLSSLSPPALSSLFTMALGTLDPAHSPYYIEYPNIGRPHQVKTEDSSSPDLSPATPASLQHFQFKFNPPPSSSHGSLSHSRASSVNSVPSIQPPPLYRFGHLPSPEGINTHHPSWPNTVSPLPPRVHSAHSAHQGFSEHHLYHLVHPPNMSYSDEYDDLSELPPDSGLGGFGGSGHSASHERTVRRRSSKACDQCRKSKCKCERTGPNEPCKSCIMLGTPCTFLGPSRKRGPPKGYIDAIEARLHQTEALLGIMLATSDPRAQSLLRDIGKDPLAKEIIARVDSSPYGVKGRKREDIALTIGGKLRSGHSSETSLTGKTKSESLPLDLTSTHPSNEWQDRVSTMLDAVVTSQPQGASSSSDRRPDTRSVAYSPKSTNAQSSDDNTSPGGRRQRRRVGDDDYTFQHGNTGAEPAGRKYPIRESYIPVSPIETQFRNTRTSSGSARRSGRERRSSSVDDNSMTSDSEEELTGAVGQLSLNEDEQVRYHGKASGLHLLGSKERVDRRNEGGIWRFPKARVWPPLPSGSTALNGEDEFVSQLPASQVQENLLDLYFSYVHPSFPVIHKSSFFESYKAGTYPESPQSPDLDTGKNKSPFNRRRRRVPTLLLLSMYALASRYDETGTPLPSDPSMMWEAGDVYLDRAKVILDSTYASSRPSTCQALLLMGYREIGIGAMAQAWTYIGMAIRMAQDLGLHRSADGWERVGLGGRLFNEWELNERKRIWFGCVIMDKYVSTYIGRPLMIFERDFDTTLPNEDDSEELEKWSLVNANHERMPSVPGRVISCFNASASLSGILSMIVQAIYAVRPVSSRHAESTLLEGLLDKWYIDLPDHLRYEPGSSKQAVPLPNVLTLHLQYWCAVLLLHRPFIRHVVHAKQKQTEDSDDPDTRAIAAKSYELCNAAANHITSIVSLFQEKYVITRCSPFLCYYVFTASIMHVTNLTVHPNDPQSRLGFTKCMHALRAMEIVWPSAGRALELFRGAKVDPSGDASDLVPLINPSSDRQKRSAEQPLDDSFISTHHPLAHQFEYMPSIRQSSQHHTQPPQQHQHQHHAGYSPQEHVNNGYTSDGGYMSAGPPSSSAPSSLAASTLVNPSYPWQGGDMNTNNFNAPLSTAVLPQLYSTGIVDESVHASHSRVHPHPDHSVQPHQSRRYPQYWNDYSSFPQMGSSAYDIHEPVQVPPQQSTHSSHMYIPEHYSIYNTQPYNSR